MSFLNRLLGITWALGGFLLMITGIFSFLSIFFADTVRALIQGIPIPDEVFDFVIIFSMIILGLFCWRLGSAMIRRQEWGAFAGGLVRVTLIFYLLAAAYLFLQDPAFYLRSDAYLSYYERFDWLIWSLFAFQLIWLSGTAYFLLWSRGRRDLYAKAYENYPVPARRTCPTCGLILDQQGLCRVCNVPSSRAYLMIGEKGRREVLEFVDREGEQVKVIGRQTADGGADVAISEKDTPGFSAISSSHIAIRYYFDHKRFAIEDLGSSHKTYLNGQELPAREPRWLAHGTQINLAQAINLVFEEAEAKSQGG